MLSSHFSFSYDFFFFLFSEPADDSYGFIYGISKRQFQVVVFAFVYQVLHKTVDRHFLRPEVFTEENHRTGVTETQIMVLYGVLEYLLHGSGTAW